MKKYIKVNDDNEIVSMFFENQTFKFDGTEIFLEDTENTSHTIYGKSLSTEFGVWIFKWIDGKIVEKTQSEIDAGTLTKVPGYKTREWLSICGLFSYTVGINKSPTEISNQFKKTRAAFHSASDIEGVKNAVKDLKEWVDINSDTDFE